MKKINRLAECSNLRVDDFAYVLKRIFTAVSVIVSVIMIKNNLPIGKCVPIYIVQWAYILGETAFREFCCRRVSFEKSGKRVSPLELLNSAKEVERNLYVCDCRVLYLYEPLAISPSEAKLIDRIEMSYVKKTVMSFTCYSKDVKIYKNFIDLGQYHSKEAADRMKAALKEREESANAESSESDVGS